MFNFLKPKPLLDDQSIEWMLATFDWAEQQLDDGYFQKHTKLVIPDAAHFPGRADSYQAMAELIFSHVVKYAGMQHWNFELIANNTCSTEDLNNTALDTFIVPSSLRTDSAAIIIDNNTALPIIYDPSQVNNPAAMIAGFSHALAHYLGVQLQTPPPGGAENWPHVTELLATYMGFGLMFANSAYISPKSCAACGDPSAPREAYLSQFDITYALAIFAHRKDLKAKDVTRHLNKPLRGFFKDALKNLQASAH